MPLQVPTTNALSFFVRATYAWVLFIAHVPFVGNRTFNATLTERLQQKHEINIWPSIGITKDVT